MTIYDAQAKKVEEFYEAAKVKDLLGKMHPDKAAMIEQFVRDYRVSIEPEEALRSYYLKLAPLETIWGRTRQLAKSVVAALECWSLAEGNAEAILAETGAWLLGEDEAGDLAQLQKLTAAFVKYFGSAGLPPALKGEELKKQVAAHHKAHAEKPVAPPAQELSSARAEKRDLAASCHTAFLAYHDFLDGYFGKEGAEAFALKSKFAYDRRVGQKRRSAAPAKDGDAQDKEKGGKPNEKQDEKQKTAAAAT